MASPVPRLERARGLIVSSLGPRLTGRGHRMVNRALHARLQLLLTGAQLGASRHGAVIDLEIDPTVKLGRGVKILAEPNSTSSLRIGPGVTLGDRVVIGLKGGSATINGPTELRRDTRLSVAGELTFEGGNVVGWGTAIHCDERVLIGELASITEYTTITDSAHYFSEPDLPVHARVRTDPVVIERGAWLCAKCTVTMGVTVGAHAIVGANTVVVADVRPATLVSGVPAREIGPVELPWSAS